MRPMFAAMGKAVGGCSLAFISGASIERLSGYGLGKRLTAVRGCRTIGKSAMRLNDACPDIRVDPETYVVTADGVHLRCEPATELPLAQRYALF
jgi:urease subunit alpha